MKTKKIIVYLLIAFFVFSPFLNLESRASFLTENSMLMNSCKVIKTICFPLKDRYGRTFTCCESYCCDSDDMTTANCGLMGTAPRCTQNPTPPKSSMLQ
jgi:hypothetical protein